MVPDMSGQGTTGSGLLGGMCCIYSAAGLEDISAHDHQSVLAVLFGQSGQMKAVKAVRATSSPPKTLL